MRLDKFLCKQNLGSRKEVKELLRRERVTVNGEIARGADMRINEWSDVIAFDGRVLVYEEFHYLMLNKPRGVVTATRDARERTVLDLPGIPLWNLSPVGRLDKDTEGLLLLTDDGALAHRLLAPKYHVWKTYEVHPRDPLSEDALERLRSGVDIGDETPTLPARARLVQAECAFGSSSSLPLNAVLEPAGNSPVLLLSVSEGRYHQVKRMLQAVGNEVMFLKRLSFGSLRLDEALPPGQFRMLTEEEIAGLKDDAKSRGDEGQECFL